MGKRGPAGQPADVKTLRGNPGNRQIPTGFIQPEGAAKEPTWLSPEAADIWRRIVAAMPPELYRVTDEGLLSAYCNACAMNRMASIVLQIESPVGTDGKKSAWYSIMRESAEQIRSLGTRLGLDPIARESIRAPDEGRPNSKFAGLTSIAGGKSA